MSDSGEFWTGIVIAGVIGAIAYYNKPLPPPVEKTACFEVIPDKENTAYKIDKCTGTSFMLVKVTVARDEKSPIKDSFTYRWYELQSGYGEANLVSGYADERLGR